MPPAAEISRRRRSLRVAAGAAKGVSAPLAAARARRGPAAVLRRRRPGLLPRWRERTAVERLPRQCRRRLAAACGLGQSKPVLEPDAAAFGRDRQGRFVALRALSGEPVSRSASARARCVRTRAVSVSVAKCGSIASACSRASAGCPAVASASTRRGKRSMASDSASPLAAAKASRRPRLAMHLDRHHAAHRSKCAGSPTRYPHRWPRRSGAHAALRTSATNDCASSKWPPSIKALRAASS